MEDNGEWGRGQMGGNQLVSSARALSCHEQWDLWAISHEDGDRGKNHFTGRIYQ